MTRVHDQRIVLQRCFFLPCFVRSPITTPPLDPVVARQPAANLARLKALPPTGDSTTGAEFGPSREGVSTNGGLMGLLSPPLAGPATASHVAYPLHHTQFVDGDFYGIHLWQLHITIARMTHCSWAVTIGLCPCDVQRRTVLPLPSTPKTAVVAAAAHDECKLGCAILLQR